MRAVVCLVLISLLAYAACVPLKAQKSKNKNIRYVVHPGLDAHPEEVASWANGYSSVYNLFFGPKPYVIGWLGEEEEEDEPFADENPDSDDKKGTEASPLPL